MDNMSIQIDFSSYMTVDGYLCPNAVPSGTVRGADNEPCFTSEYYIIKQKNNDLSTTDIIKYLSLIQGCINSDGYLTRAPGDTTLGNPDNSFGVYAGLVVLNQTLPVKYYWELLRMPQLYFTSLCASKSVKWYKPWQWPLHVISAVIIALSCMNTDTNNTDARRLSWLLIQATKPYSFLCSLASKIWFKRLHKDYANGLKDVYGIYYYPQGLNNNPYSKWVIE